MKRKSFVALACVLIFVFGMYPAPGESDPPRILRPVDRTVLSSGLVEIAVVVPSGEELPSIVVDGQKLKLSSALLSAKGEGSASPPSGDCAFLPPALVIVRSFSPGLHKLSAGPASVQFFVRDEKGKEIPPSGWSHYVAHPPAGSGGVTCVGCHELSEKHRFVNMNDAFFLEKPLGCFDCHERSEFNLTHNHRYEALAFCQMCHDPHGATGEHLLKLPKKKACTLCHE